MSDVNPRPSITISDDHWGWMVRAQAAEGRLERALIRVQELEDQQTKVGLDQRFRSAARAYVWHFDVRSYAPFLVGGASFWLGWVISRWV